MAARSQTALMTAEELWDIPDGFSRDELFEGTLLEISPASAKHGRLSMRFGWRLMDHVDVRGLGVVYDGSAGCIIERSPDSVLSPDVLFVKADRAPDNEEGYLDLAPDLAVEFISSSNRPGYVDAKIKMLACVTPSTLAWHYCVRPCDSRSAARSTASNTTRVYASICC